MIWNRIPPDTRCAVCTLVKNTCALVMQLFAHSVRGCLECVRVSAYPAAEGELLARGWMLDVQRTLVSLQTHSLNTDN